jgi:putative transposase
MGHTFSRIVLHVIFSTKGRRNSLYRDMRRDMLEYLHGIARHEGVGLLAANAVEDHVHLLLAVKPVHAPSALVRTIKTNSSRWIHETYADLDDFGWQSGFGVFSVSESAVADVVAYIRDQERHHRRMPFAQELQLFLERHGVEYDPEHFLD